MPQLEALTNYEQNVTVNVGTFSGGSSVNTVPETAVIQIDCRFATRQAGLQLCRMIEQLCTRPLPDASSQHLPETLTGVRFELESLGFRAPMEATHESKRLMAAYHSCLTGLAVQAGEAGLQGGASDGNILSAHGVPCIDGLGPYGQYYHQPREWISLSSLRNKTKALARLLAAVLEAEVPGHTNIAPSKL